MKRDVFKLDKVTLVLYEKITIWINRRSDIRSWVTCTWINRCHKNCFRICYSSRNDHTGIAVIKQYLQHSPSLWGFKTCEGNFTRIYDITNFVFMQEMIIFYPLVSGSKQHHLRYFIIILQHSSEIHILQIKSEKLKVDITHLISKRRAPHRLKCYGTSSLFMMENFISNWISL